MTSAENEQHLLREQLLRLLALEEELAQDVGNVNLQLRRHELRRALALPAQLQPAHAPAALFADAGLRDAALASCRRQAADLASRRAELQLHHAAAGGVERVNLEMQLRAIAERESEVAQLVTALAALPDPAAAPPAPAPARQDRAVPAVLRAGGELCLPAELHGRLRKLLMQCEEFESHSDLRSLFSDERLQPWRSGLRETSNIKSRVDQTIDYLRRQMNSAGEPVLLLFLQVLAERYDEENARHQELLALWNELNGPATPAQPEAPLPAADPPGTVVPPEPLAARLSGPDIGRLRDILLEAFNPPELDDLLYYQLDQRRSDIALGGSQREIVGKVIEHYNRQQMVPQLLNAARLANPTAGDLALFARRQGLRGGLPANTPAGDNLERIIRQSNSMQQPLAWLSRLAAIIGQVCRVTVNCAGRVDHGSGFLLGPDLIITNYHVVERLIKGIAQAQQVTVLFDYLLLADGVTPHSGSSYGLAESDWLVDYAEYSPLDRRIDRGAVPQADQLDYALLRLAGAPGEQPVGGAANLYPHAGPRGWIRLPPDEPDFAPNSAVYIVQYPQGRELQLALESQGIIGLNANGTRVRYATNTEHGSSGSPCFDANWNLIALHHSGDPNYAASHDPQYNQGIPLPAIRNLLRERGKLAVLGGAA
jgi:hypothetical protein